MKTKAIFQLITVAVVLLALSSTAAFAQMTLTKTENTDQGGTKTTTESRDANGNVTKKSEDIDNGDGTGKTTTMESQPGGATKLTQETREKGEKEKDTVEVQNGQITKTTQEHSVERVDKTWSTVTTELTWGWVNLPGGVRIRVPVRKRVYGNAGGKFEDAAIDLYPREWVELSRAASKATENGDNSLARQGLAVMQGVVFGIPAEVPADQDMSFTVASLNGEVIPNQEVTLSSGSGLFASVKTDENGKARFHVPENWQTLRAQVFQTVASALVGRIRETGRDQAPVIQRTSNHFVPGTITEIDGANFDPDLDLDQVTINGIRARVAGATRGALMILVPADLEPGNAQLAVTANGKKSAPFSANIVTLSWDDGPSTLMKGQTVTRTLRVRGTTERVLINVIHPEGDAASASVKGSVQSSGGKNNVVAVKLYAERTGAYFLQARIVDGR